MPVFGQKLNYVARRMVVQQTGASVALECVFHELRPASLCCGELCFVHTFGSGDRGPYAKCNSDENEPLVGTSRRIEHALNGMVAQFGPPAMVMLGGPSEWDEDAMYWRSQAAASACNELNDRTRAAACTADLTGRLAPYDCKPLLETLETNLELQVQRVRARLGANSCLMVRTTPIGPRPPRGPDIDHVRRECRAMLNNVSRRVATLYIIAQLSSCIYYFLTQLLHPRKLAVKKKKIYIWW